jgi:ATP-dependent DNA helicase PIF1
VEFICRKVRDGASYFGQLQVVCVGDFYQLRPVPDDLHNDPGLHAFTSPVWKCCITHTVTLQQVHRQGDQSLIRAVNELAKGLPGPETNMLMDSLSQPLSHGGETVNLYGTNYEVDCHNSIALMQVDGAMTVYRADDSGDTKKLNRVMARRVVSLKVGCPVMLVKNLSPKLVNGSIGIVIALDRDCPTVQFDGTVVKLKKEAFTVFDCRENMVVAERLQFPIMLAYAMTVYKSQGLTIPRLIVDCRGIRQPDEIGVAVGRSVDVDGLCVLHYTLSCSKKHLREVGEFCEDPGLPPDDDMSCCKRVSIAY